MKHDFPCVGPGENESSFRRDGDTLKRPQRVYAMPYINLQITAGASRKQKALIVRDFSSVLVNHVGEKPEHIHILIDEVKEENWGYSGLLTDDYRESLNKNNRDEPGRGGDG